MSNTWDKVRCFLDMMDIQDLHSHAPFSFTPSSSSSSSTSNVQALSVTVDRLQVGEKTTKNILAVIQPTADSENRRKEIIEYMQALIEDTLGIKVFPFGSVPLKTYLPHGDVDLTAVSHYDTSQDLATEICRLLQNEERNNTRIQVRDVLYVPAQVRVVKCTVGNISVDISFNQTAGLRALCFLEQVDQFIGKDHLCKRSVILIKAWCYYESRLLGGFHGLISTYALETLVLHVINHFHSSLHCPLAVLYKFLEYYSTFDWQRYCVGINGLVLISSLPDIVVHPPHDCDELLLTDDFLRSSREAFLPCAEFRGSMKPVFSVKFLNILDPLRDDNNLGRSVSKGNFYRIRSALAYGTQKLGDILMLPLEKIEKGLEKFFVNTLESNGRGRRADVQVPVPVYGAEISASNGNNDNLLGGIQYGLWFHDYGVIYPLQTNSPATLPVWNNGWVEMGQNMQYDQNMYYNLDESPPSSVDSPTALEENCAASAAEKGKFRGTGPYIPHIGHTCLEECAKEEESGMEAVYSLSCTPRDETFSDEGGNSCIFNFSMDDFPLLPGSKPIPVSQTEFPKCEQVNETLASVDSLEFGSLKCLSPRSVSLSEPSKLSDSDVSVILDSPGDPVVSVEDDQESSKTEEKPVEPEPPLQLADDKEFPPLLRPPKPEMKIQVNKKEFPPLSACLKPDRKGKWKKRIQ